MAEAPKAGGPLKKLTPKQKRYALVLGAAAVLALIYLLQRRSGAPEEGQAPSNPEGAAVAGGSPSYPVGGGGTDPSAFIGAQSEGVGSALGEVSNGLGEVSVGLGEVVGSNDRLGVQVETDLDEVGEAQARTLAALGKQGKNITAIRHKLAKPARPVKGKPGSGKPQSKQKPGSGKPQSKQKPPKPQPKPQPKPKPPAPKPPKKKGKK
jgi:hypothetical protein